MERLIPTEKHAHKRNISRSQKYFLVLASEPDMRIPGGEFHIQIVHNEHDQESSQCELTWCTECHQFIKYGRYRNFQRHHFGIQWTAIEQPQLRAAYINAIISKPNALFNITSKFNSKTKNRMVNRNIFFF